MTDRWENLMADYRDHAHESFPPPDVSDLTTGPWRGRRRQRRVVALAVLTTAVAAVALVGFVVLPRVVPPDDPAPVATSIETVDWTNTELTVPPNPDNRCPEGRVRLYPRVPPWAERGNFTPKPLIGVSAKDPDRESRVLQTMDYVVLGDLTGDGAQEAVVAVRCSTTLPDRPNDPLRRQFLVVTMRPDHSLVGLQFVGNVSAGSLSARIVAGQLWVQMRYNSAYLDEFNETAYDTAFTQVFGWNGTSFDRVAGRTAPLNFTGRYQGYGVPSQLADILSPTGEVLCPAALVPFGYAPYTVGDYTYDFGLLEVGKTDVDDDGNEQIAVAVRCTGNGYDAVSLYVFAQGEDRFRTLDVPVANDGSWIVGPFVASPRSIGVEITATNDDRLTPMTFTWNGQYFGPALGSYRSVD